MQSISVLLRIAKFADFRWKMLMSAELKGCVTWFIYFFDLLWLRYNCAKFHHCRTYVWQIIWNGSLLAPRLPNPWAASKRPILNRVKGHKSNDPISSIYFYRSNCLQRSFLYLKIAKIHYVVSSFVCSGL